MGNKATAPLIVKSPAGAAYTLTRKSGVAYWTFSATLKKPSGAPVGSKRLYLKRSTNGIHRESWSTGMR